MPGAVVKKSDTTLVIYSVFETRPSKTEGKLNKSKFIRGAVVKKSDTTTVIYNVLQHYLPKYIVKSTFLNFIYKKQTVFRWF